MIHAMEVWLHAFAFPGHVAQLAHQAEEWGFTGLLVADSQNLNADIWVELALAGAVTSTLLLGPGVTNPVTRHPAVTASAAATLQAETGGRAVLGLGRGDSAVTQIGRRPVPVPEFERALEALQGYLRGEEVRLEGTTSAIHWLADAGLDKVPLEVAATGPRTIAAAARQAEGVDFSVGAELGRLRWAIELARETTPKELSLGAFINVAVDSDREAARELVRGSVAIFARFATEGAPTDGLSEVTRSGIQQLASGYEAERHGEAAAPQAQLLDGEFIDRFAVAGPPEEVRDRLAEMGAAGIDRLIVVPGSLDADPVAVAKSNRRFARDVLPQLVGTQNATLG
jgi:5,10-methylenetetrahydromethanopterin reductase